MKLQLNKATVKQRGRGGARPLRLKGHVATKPTVQKGNDFAIRGRAMNTAIQIQSYSSTKLQFNRQAGAGTRPLRLKGHVPTEATIKQKRCGRATNTGIRMSSYS